MNIALSAVIISILLIPPLVFYLSLYIGRFPRAIPKFSLFEGILASAVVSLLIHAVAISLIPNEIRFDILIKVLGGDLKDVENTIKNRDLKSAVTDFALYNAVLMIIMIGFGRAVRWRLLVSGLHMRNEVFNLYNKWWYFFNGNYADVGAYDLVLVDAVVDTKDGTMVYSGFVVNFETKGGDLDRIYISDAVRREFKTYTGAQNMQLANQAGEPVQIPGAILSIKYENVINLNVNFILIEEEGNLPENDLPLL